MNKFLDRMKQHWQINSNLQAILILIVFALTGFSTLYSHRLIDYLLGIDNSSDLWLKSIIFVFLILPIYTILLYIWGILLGQKKFFTKFIRIKIKLLSMSMLRRKKNK